VGKQCHILGQKSGANKHVILHPHAKINENKNCYMRSKSLQHISCYCSWYVFDCRIMVESLLWHLWV